MTRVYLDQQEISFSPPNFMSLEQVVKHVEDTHLLPNTVIREIHVDGLPVGPEELQQGSAGSLDRIGERERIEILTGSVTEIAQESIGEAISYLQRVEAATPSLAASFQVTPGPEAFETLRQFYDGFYWLNLLLDRLVTTFRLALDNVYVQGVDAQEHHARFGSILKQLVEAQERGDFVLVADLVEYEILPIVPIWRGMFEAIRENIGRQANQ